MICETGVNLQPSSSRPTKDFIDIEEDFSRCQSHQSPDEDGPLLDMAKNDGEKQKLKKALSQRSRKTAQEVEKTAKEGEQCVYSQRERKKVIRYTP